MHLGCASRDLHSSGDIWNLGPISKATGHKKGGARGAAGAVKPCRLSPMCLLKCLWTQSVHTENEEDFHSQVADTVASCTRSPAVLTHTLSTHV